MTRRTWTSATPGLYDRLMAPLESGPVGRWRRRLWSGVPHTGLGLEVGAGTGANVAHHPAGAFTVASDLTPRLIRSARARSRARTRTGLPTAPVGHASRALVLPRTAFVAADALALPFRAGTFDWAVATFVFCEVPDPARGFAELRRVLRRAGTLHMLEHVRPAGILGHAAAALSRVTGPLLGEHFDRRTMRAAEDAGFRVTSAEWLLRSSVVLFRAT